MLKKREMKIKMTAREQNPPVLVLYSAYPLYLSRVVWEKRSNDLRMAPKEVWAGILQI